MSTVIVTTSPGFATVGKVPSFIEEKGWKLHRCVDTGRPHGGVLDYAADMDFLVVGLIPATAELMDKAPKLKAILKHGVGVDNIDIPAATARKIPVLNAPGANSNAVKELVLAGMLMGTRNIFPALNFVAGLEGDDASLHKQVEAGKKNFVGHELRGATLGIIGLGAIGSGLAESALALGMSVIGYDPVLTVEGAWRLPLSPVYDALIDSRLADIKNTGGRPAGSITAAQFLQRFIRDGQPWVHIDIAGVALPPGATDLAPKGATGWGVMTLNRMIRDNFEG